MVASLTAASILVAGSLVLFVGELVGAFHIVHPLFWLPICAGSIGIVGSNYIYLKTYLKRP